MTDDRIRLAAQAVADALNPEKCPVCGASFRTPACWKRDKSPHGEYCLRGEGHDGEHNNIMSGWRWTECPPPVPGVICGASGPSSVFGDDCTFLANHDGPHSFSPPSHKDGCALDALRRALAEPAEPAQEKCWGRCLTEDENGEPYDVCPRCGVALSAQPAATGEGA